MPDWEAPAKLNLDLRIGPVDSGGMHPLCSLAQTIEWTDRILLEEGDEDHLEVVGRDLLEGGDNLVWRAVEALGLDPRPRLHIRLEKAIPVAAGLGGGSSDAAATLRAVGGMLGIDDTTLLGVAPRIGADVAYFLSGGTAIMEGYGERLTPLEDLTGFAVAVAVPPFELATPAVYESWDQLGGPLGPRVTGKALPPSLRSQDELRNDLTPAAIALRPELADWMQDLARRWERTVIMSGSGPACFGFFVDHDEASDALEDVPENRAALAAELRPRGVARIES